MSSLPTSITDGDAGHIGHHEELHGLIDSGTYRPKRVVDMVTDYGVHPDETAATNAQGINQAISDAATDGRTTVELAFAAGVHDIDDVVGYSASSDSDIAVHLKGQGRRGSALRQTDDSLDVMSFTNTVQNLRGIVVEDMWLRGGKRALHLERVLYSVFRNVVFNQQVAGDNGAVAWSGPSMLNVFDQCWWVHSNAKDAIRAADGGHSTILTGCVIGEDVGGIATGSDKLAFSACMFHNFGAKLPSGDDGPGSLGSYGIFAQENGHVSVTNSWLRLNSGTDQLLITLRPLDVVFAHSRINLTGSDALWTNYRARGYGAVKFRDNRIVFADDGATTKTITQEEASGSADIINSSMDGNTIVKPSTKGLQMDDAWFDPSRNNTMGDNKVVET